ncbi:MAG: transcriptional regulator, partial [Pseudomonadota bacterium]
PESAGADHLKALARVARVLRDERNSSVLRQTSDAKDIYKVLIQPATSNAA